MILFSIYVQSNGHIFKPWWRHQWRGTLMFSLICVWINDWVNNCEAGDLRRHSVHYDVSVMQIPSIPMGGNASPFIADVNVLWCEYHYITKLMKTDYTLAKMSYNCRYLNNMCIVNFTDFCTIAKDIYDNIFILEDNQNESNPLLLFLAATKQL